MRLRNSRIAQGSVIQRVNRNGAQSCLHRTSAPSSKKQKGKGREKMTYSIGPLIWLPGTSPQYQIAPDNPLSAVIRTDIWQCDNRVLDSAFNRTDRRTQYLPIWSDGMLPYLLARFQQPLSR